MAYWSHKTTHDEAWRFLVEVIKPDVALSQEAHTPTDETIRKKTVLVKIGGTRDWGSGVYSIYSSKEIEFENSYPGSLVGVEIELPSGRKLAIISLYGKLETKNGDSTGFATTSVHKMISDLNWILLGLGKFAGLENSLVLGGDFNASIQLDNTWRAGAGRYLNAHRILFERIEDYGLKSVFDYPEKQKSFVQTHRHGRSKKPWQNDYIFLSGSLHSRIKKVEVIDNAEVRLLSDHNPVVVDIDTG
jgi:exonuclease III